MLLRRLLAAIPTLGAIVVLSFFIVRLAPGSPFSGERSLAPEVQAALHSRYGLDQPLSVQLGRYVRGLCHGDLGPSIKYPEHSVAELIGGAWPHTALLAACALAWALLMAGLMGLAMALDEDGPLGTLAAGLSTMLMGTPSFVLAPLLVLALAGRDHGLPPAGWGAPVHLVLPSLTLGAIVSGGFARLLAGGLRGALRSDYVRCARAKGLGFIRVLLGHALWAALGPLCAYAAPACAGLLAGSVAVEQIFNVPGLGPYFVDAAQNRDYFLVMGIVLVDAALLVAMNFLADVALLWCDPRVRVTGNLHGTR